jgi:hypothetical protein
MQFLERRVKRSEEKVRGLGRNDTNSVAKQALVVAETGTDGNLVASLGTPAAQHGCARLGLHAGQKPVCLRAMAAVRLKGALRHIVKLLLNLFSGLQQSFSIPQGAQSSNGTANEGDSRLHSIDARFEVSYPIAHERERSSQGMVQ